MSSNTLPVQCKAPAPELGEHTARVLTELLGLDAQEIDRLAAAGIILT